MIKQKFEYFKQEVNGMSHQDIRAFFRHENPNDLITFLEDEPYFKTHFPWNEQLNEKHILYMLEHRIPIQWFTLSMSEDIPFSFIQNTWRKILPYQEDKDEPNKLSYNWRPLTLMERSDLTKEIALWLIKRTSHWSYAYNQVYKKDRYTTPKNDYSPRMKNVHTELLFRPPYLEGLDKPCFRFLEPQAFLYLKQNYGVMKNERKSGKNRA